MTRRWLIRLLRPRGAHACPFCAGYGYCWTEEVRFSGKIGSNTFEDCTFVLSKPPAPPEVST